MTTLTKAEIAESLVNTMKMDKVEAKKFVDILFEQMRNALAEGHNLKISGFGRFELRDKRQRPGRNPKTGKEVPVSARRVVSFHAGQKFKNRIEGLPFSEEDDED